MERMKSWGRRFIPYLPFLIGDPGGSGGGLAHPLLSVIRCRHATGPRKEKSDQPIKRGNQSWQSYWMKNRSS